MMQGLCTGCVSQLVVCLGEEVVSKSFSLKFNIEKAKL